MKWKFKVNVTTLLVIALGVVVFFFWNGKKNDEIGRWKGNYEAQNTEFVTYRSEANGAIVAKDQAILILNDELKAALHSDSIQRALVSKYKKLSSVVKVETVFRIDTVKVSVPIYLDADTTVKLSHDCFEADLTLTSGLLSLDGLTIENRQDIVIGARKPMLRKEKQYVEITNTNKCISTTGMTSYVIVNEKKWWENPIITTLGGFTAGFVAAKLTK